MIKNKKYYTLEEHFNNLVKNKYFRKTIVKEVVRSDKRRTKNSNVFEQKIYEIVDYDPSITLVVGENIFCNVNPIIFFENSKNKYILDLPVIKIRIDYNNIRVDERKSYRGIDTIINIPNEIMGFDSESLKYTRDPHFVSKYNGQIVIYCQDLSKDYVNSVLYKKELLNKDIFVALKTFGNSVYRFSTYEKALDYYKNKSDLESAISKAVGFDIYIREPNVKFEEKEVEDLKTPYMIIESKK